MSLPSPPVHAAAGQVISGWHGTTRGVSGCTLVPEGSQDTQGEELL